MGWLAGLVNVCFWGGEGDGLVFAEFFDPVCGIFALSRGYDCDIFFGLVLGVWDIFWTLAEIEWTCLVVLGCV